MTPKNPPIIERTEIRGTVELKFPGLEASFPATNRSIAMILIAGFITIIIVVPVCFYEVFNARPEALETVGNIIGGRKPEKVPIQTDDGIEMIEVCPPCPQCPTCEELGCASEPPTITRPQPPEPPAMMSYR
jgi:hypothetical protein